MLPIWCWDVWARKLQNFCVENTNQVLLLMWIAAIVINAEKVRLTGDKWTGRVYLRHTGYPGGQREYTPADLMAKDPDRLIRKVVRGMLPKNRLGDKIINNLYVFAGAEHNMQAQKPKQIDLNSLK